MFAFSWTHIHHHPPLSECNQIKMFSRPHNCFAALHQQWTTTATFTFLTLDPYIDPQPRKISIHWKVKNLWRREKSVRGKIWSGAGGARRAWRPSLGIQATHLEKTQNSRNPTFSLKSTRKLTLSARGTFSALGQSSPAPGDRPPALCSIFSPFWGSATFT